ncbi:MAG TPA: prepilin peptidase [Amycolatopsis sp.]|uniref:prepilin peptidase n=1 Tax=Amycolatopsis sp. TaxID=37632 RepID=UPI002B46FB78|nr:prepilin peptidase [Amycolatopsis sp.]HKS46799.1 prepilin peptidase [Amycolatopsis sp.]
MDAKILIAFPAGGMGAGALGWHALRRARSPAPVPAGPVVLGAGLLWLMAGARWLTGAWPAWWLPVPLTLAALAVPLAVADLRYLRLPDVLTLPAYPLLGLAVVAASVAGAGGGLAVRALLGGLAFGGLHLLVHALSRRSLGAGDVKLAGVAGAVLGAVGWHAVLTGGVLAAVVTMMLAIRPRWRGGVPHGPGLLAATWLVTVFPGSGSGVGMGT